jgi:outer membrane protein assembly factor BamB
MSQPTLTLLVGLVAALLLVLWWLFFSRTRFFTRLAVTLALVAFAGTASLVVEFRGLSGDLVPRFGRRGGATPHPIPPASAPTPAPTEAPPATPASPPPSSRGAPLESGDEGSAGTANPSGPAEEGSRRMTSDFPQFLGPNRDATVRGASLSRQWSPSPPVAVWRQPIGKGWSGFAVADGLAVTLEQRDGQEMVVAYEIGKGRTRWSHRGGKGFESALAGDGPRATPALANGRAYTLGVNGTLTALDLGSGRVLFEKDVLGENGAGRPEHGVASSPLVIDDVVVVLAGGPRGRSLVAYDARTGERRWSGGDDPAAYSSPRVATLGGVRQIVVLSLRNLAGHDIGTGAVLWQDPWPDRAEKVSQPVLLDDDRVFVSMGYGIGGRMVKVSRTPEGSWRADVLWRTQQLKAKFTQVVHHGGFLYGLDEGVLVCLDPKDGERRWKSGRYGHGQVLLVDDVLLVQAENGEVAMVDPRPEKHVELGRFQAVDGRAWATPALAGDLLLVRGDVEAACYRLPTEKVVAAAPLRTGPGKR